LSPHPKIYSNRRSFLNHSFKYFGYFISSCLALFVAVNVLYVGSVFAFGHPNRLPYAYYGMYGGVYQLFNCGLTSEVENPFTCDR
jgi:hypothetical protein